MTRILAVFFAWVAVYVAVTATLAGFQWAGLDMPLPAQTFVLTAVLVPTMIFIIGPFTATLAQYLLRKFG
jgi:heme/copper-type cytochrome/quinol oxidase subunit 3